MPLRMAGVWINATVEIDGRFFDLSSNNAFANSIESITVEMNAGGGSNFDINLAPTFTQAVEIIESGFLGFGHPIIKAAATGAPLTVIKGFAAERSDSGINGTTSFGGSKDAKSGKTAASLAVRMGYGGETSENPRAQTPWLYGTILAPSISFGQEIQITLKGTSSFYQMFSDDTPGVFEGQTLLSVVQKVISKSVKGNVLISKEAKELMGQTQISANKSENSASFLKQLLEPRGFTFYFDGGSFKDPKEQIIIATSSEISRVPPPLTLRMYGQINPGAGIYPIESFSSEISHMSAAAAIHGTKNTHIDTSEKKEIKTKADIDDYKKARRPKGPTVPTKPGPTKPTNRGGPTAGDPDGGDSKRAGRRMKGVDKDDLESIKNAQFDATEGAVKVECSCPFIPEALPNKLVRVEIFTGRTDKGKALFATISGVYRIISVKHSISASGGSTDFELIREAGSAPITQESVVNAESVQTDAAPKINFESTSLIKGAQVKR